MFYNTSIPTTIIALKKNRSERDILFIDASKQFVKGKKQNTLSEENIDHIVELYVNRKDAEKEAHLASYEEIQSNDYNLNIPRYVDTFEQEEEISLSDVTKQLQEEEKEIEQTQKELLSQFAQLTTDDKQTESELETLMKTLEGLF